MKLLLSICLVLSFASCKKESTASNCYDCHLQGVVNGVSYNEHREYCGDEPIPTYTDPGGTPIPVSCVRK